MKTQKTFMMSNIFQYVLSFLILLTSLLFTSCSGNMDAPVTNVPITSVSIDTPREIVAVGMFGPAIFPVTTAYIASGQACRVVWYTSAAGTILTTAPVGITVSVSNVVNNAATVTMNASTAVVGGEYYFKVVVGYAQSGVSTLVVTNGAQQHPYQIATTEQLAQIAALVNTGRNFSDIYFVLTNDIDLGVAPYNSGVGWTPIGNILYPFRGNFNGAGHKVSNLFIDGLASYVGLFGYVNNGCVQNLGVEIAVGGISGSDRIGGVAGWIQGGSITDCYVTGDVSGRDYVGGLAGWIQNSTITNCYVTSDISGRDFSGGVAGWIQGGAITDSYTTGNVLGRDYIGGVAGVNHSNITNCYASGSVSGFNNVGGVAGIINGSITNSVALNSIVRGGTYVGRVTGRSDGILDNNWARDDMGRNGGTPFTLDETTHQCDGIDGADCLAVPTVNWWETVMTTWSTSVWHFKDNRLPKLL